ncbi:hypothetical protein DICPUDRAFT_159045 [Dictyostelium purpureum]|uniref:Uncharacterized protein n=1 Tax=Dictyostelium purpureum TaxID=5786 RepID=F1A348_DICPU|nr:uncharacterized protein DICPUDRAFT_159045 [Dictyostelium purpureum]EGC29379.1 hypothetical protein DICPUDRAFT_159045 [Dictyostelium purpureum]|eukprot:XP_003294092.1 hypothetical protein DICPUDRAFT_159045 [Dictyostelium purpureum]
MTKTQEAHSFCEDASDQYPWKPKDDVFFEAGQKKEYSFDCKILKPNNVKKMFGSKLLFNVSGFSGTAPTCCLLHIDKSKIEYFYGYKITIPANPIGFSDLYFDVKFCQATALYSKEKVGQGSIFKQILVLDVTPSFLASSVYIFLGMAVFSLVLSCLIISAIIHRWKSSDNISITEDRGYRGNKDIELKSILCDITYKTTEERNQYYLSKIDSFFNFNEYRPSILPIGTYDSSSELNNNNNSNNSNNSNNNNSNSNKNENNDYISNSLNCINNNNYHNDNNSYYNDLNNRDNRYKNENQISYSPTYHHNHYNEYILNSNINLNCNNSSGNGKLINVGNNSNQNYNYSFNSDYNNKNIN